MGHWARRGFIRGVTTMLALGTGSTLLPRTAAALGPFHARRTLLIDGAAVGPVLTAVDAPATTTEEIAFRCGTGMNKSLYAWLQAGPDGTSRRSGALVDATGERLEFTNALLTELTLPALDRARAEPAWLGVKARAESVRRTPGARLRSDPAPDGPPRWLATDFRLRIDGLEDACAHALLIDAITLRPRPARDALVLQWEHPAREGLDAPDLVLTLAEAHAAALVDWHEAALAQRPIARAGSLHYLADDADSSELFALRFAAVRPLRLTPLPAAEGAPRRVRVELACDDARFTFTPAALAG